MNVDIEKYEIISKVFIGTTFQLVFQNIYDKKDKKVLDLKQVAAFSDTIDTRKIIRTLRIDTDSSYALEISSRLDQPEFSNFPEVYLFDDKHGVHFCFKAVAQFIEFRDWIEGDE
jgi:hypothetical protein